MTRRTGALLLLLALAEATAERYYDEKSSYPVKSSGESEGCDYHRIQFDLLGIQYAADKPTGGSACTR